MYDKILCSRANLLRLAALIRRVSLRILSVHKELQGQVVTIISMHGPQRGKNKEGKFHDGLTAEVQSRNGRCFVLGDFKCHVGSYAYEYDGVHVAMNGEKATEMVKML